MQLQPYFKCYYTSYEDVLENNISEIFSFIRTNFQTIFAKFIQLYSTGKYYWRQSLLEAIGFSTHSSNGRWSLNRIEQESGQGQIQFN